MSYKSLVFSIFLRMCSTFLSNIIQPLILYKGEGETKDPDPYKNSNPDPKSYHGKKKRLRSCHL